jgi:D-3-phosphoglycerate dehydrogenase
LTLFGIIDGLIWEVAAMKFKVLVTDHAWPTLEVEREVLSEVDAELIAAETGEEAELTRLVPDCDGIMTCWKHVTARVLDAAPRCRIVSRYGVGLDNIAVDRATELGMLVTSVPDYCVEEVSDQAMGLLLTCARRITQFSHETRVGIWDLKGGGLIPRLRGQTVGLIGFGRIARALVPKALGFGMKVLAYDPYLTERPNMGKSLVYADGLEDVLREADYVSLHVPLNKETTHLINAERLRLMKPNAYLINTCRGGVIDESALLEALREGWIAGAGLDVLTEEPPSPDHLLLGLTNAFLTPHTAFYSEDSIEELQRRGAEHVADVLRGKLPENIVNPQVQHHPEFRMR